MDMSSFYNFNKDTKVLIDTNILIFVFYPLSTNSIKVNQYTNILEKLRENNSKLYMTSTVISEFINRWLRLDFEKNFQNEERSKEFKKDYRISHNYEKTIKQILKIIQKIYKNYNIENIEDGFSNFDIINKYKNTDIDFGDLLILHVAEENNLKILTDDKDLKAINNITI